MSDAVADVVDQMVGIESVMRLDAIRRMRPQARANAQASYVALFEPADADEVSIAERFAIAVFVAGLHGDDRLAAFYEGGLAAHDAALLAPVRDEVTAGAATGPYGNYPAGPLSVEDASGPVHRVDAGNAGVLGGRLSAALEHAHMLVFHPRDARLDHLVALLDAGWSTTGIVTLSQLVAFLSFQIRAVAGLRTLAAAMTEAVPAAASGRRA